MSGAFINGDIEALLLFEGRATKLVIFIIIHIIIRKIYRFLRSRTCRVNSEWGSRTISKTKAEMKHSFDITGVQRKHPGIPTSYMGMILSLSFKNSFLFPWQYYRQQGRPTHIENKGDHYFSPS